MSPHAKNGGQESPQGLGRLYHNDLHKKTPPLPYTVLQYMPKKALGYVVGHLRSQLLRWSASS